MAGCDVTRFPDEVWQHILALRHLDRDQASPTAALIRQLWDRAPYVRLRAHCTRCRHPRAERMYWVTGGFSERGRCPPCEELYSCLMEEQWRHLRWEFLRPPVEGV